MRFETNTGDLCTAVTIAARFVERKANLPALASILVVVHDGKVTLRATNLEYGVEITVAAKVVTEGVAAIPAGVFVGFFVHSLFTYCSLSYTHYFNMSRIW